MQTLAVRMRAGAVEDSMPMHELKCTPEFFKAVFERDKNFEIRKNDRDFRVGDMLLLKEFTGSAPNPYTGEWCARYVVYITDFPDGLRDGYVCMGIK